MISQPLHWLLLFIQSGQATLFGLDIDLGGVGNWGLAIIIITIIVKGLMYPLTKHNTHQWLACVNCNLR